MIVPAGHRVLVRPDKKEEKTAGGIIIAETIREKEELAGIYGTVVAMGETAYKAFDDGERWCEVGDRVCFAKYGGFVIEDPETKEQFRILNDDDIVAVLRQGEN